MGGKGPMRSQTRIVLTLTLRRSTLAVAAKLHQRAPWLSSAGSGITVQGADCWVRLALGDHLETGL